MDPQKLPLRDIHLPEPVSWWPPAPGWWLVLGLVIVAGALAFWLYRRPKPRTAPRRLALRELERLQAAYGFHRDSRRLAGELSVLLRRTAISQFPRSEAAGLTGEAWLAYLDQILGQDRFTKGVGRQLISAPYWPAAEVEAEALLGLCREWIEALPKTRPPRNPSAAHNRRGRDTAAEASPADVG